ncbi:condensation domain-containing protein, partial [Alkalimonas amylolytica]|uniref:condensation domain-containing protein n=1 Tax=Alkalimonas amylolytica TaxID=152573 RepID=UPI001FECF755
LAVIWQELLGVERVGRRDNFFALGGHSLLATRLASHIRQQLGVNVALRSLFEHNDLVGQAALVVQTEQGEAIPAIVPVQQEGPLPLSFAQQRLWLLDQIEGGSRHYHMPVVLQLRGELDSVVAQQALQQIVQRHAVLRTRFAMDADGEPYQEVREDAQIILQMEDVQALESDAQASAVRALMASALEQPFDLSQDLMLRVLLIRQSLDEYVLVTNMHHIASDGWSMGVLVKEFVELYRAGVEGIKAELPELTVQYGDYAAWQRDYLQGEVLERQLSYWREQLADAPVLHGLPLDKVRPKQQSFVGRTVQSELGVAQTQGLKQLCQQEGATLFMGLHAVFSALLSRYSNETDIVVGSPVANREQSEVAGLIGFFVNTLVLRSEVSANAGLVDLVRQSKERCLSAYAHQQVPFEKLVDVLQVERSLSHHPLFQVMLVLQNNEVTELTLPGLTLSPMASAEDSAKFDLTLTVQEVNHILQLSWNYNSDLFEAATIVRMAEHFTRLVTEALQAPTTSVHGLELLSGGDMDQFNHWNNTATEHPVASLLHEPFEAMARQYPAAIA